jgi:transmembrane serine protease 3
MAKRFVCAMLMACFSLIDALLLKGTTEHITVNGNRVNQSLTDLQNGTSRLGHRVNIEYAPMDCQVRKYSGIKFYGTIATSGNWIESEDICVSICWQYKTQGWPCSSANYIQSKSTCELMQDIYGEAGMGDNLYIKSDATSTYLIPISCKKPGQPQPQPTPAPTPNPQPQPGDSGSTTNIRPGSCGQASVPQRVSRSYLQNKVNFQRIVGGNEARPHSIPFIVSLRSNNWHFCGGTLIRVNNKDESDIVVTASHCMGGDLNNPGFDVVAGAHFTNRKQNGEQSVRAAKVIMHPNYNKPGSNANDVAVVKLSKPIKFSDTIQPACLPAQNENVKDGTNGIVAGWGALREGASGPQGLNQVVVPTIGSASCKQMYGNIIPEAMLCAGYDQGQKDSCQGDSGGPYFFEGKNGYTLHGVVSWGAGCARPRSPGVYARVATYMDWIQQQVKVLSAVRS